MMFHRCRPTGFFVAAFALFVAGGSGQAMACANTGEVMAHFEKIKNAYVAKAPSMAPDKFQVWTGYLQQFGNAMGKADFAGACGLLDKASAELGFDVAAAGAAAPAAAAAAAAPAVAAPAQPAPATPAPATPQPETPAVAAPQPAQPAAAAGGQAVWVECPRGRCWARDELMRR